MESPIQEEVTKIYHRMLHSRALLKQLDQVEFSTQPKEIVYRENKLLLYHFQPQVKKPFLTPLLLVFSLINRPDILDFSAEDSFIKALLQAGRDVYLIDWGYPAKEDQSLSLSDYIGGYLRACVKKIKLRSRQPQLDLLGVCQGGVFAVAYASLFPKEVRQLVLISTPIDFQTKEDTLSRFANKLAVDEVVQKKGNIPGVWLAQVFASLRPFHLLGKKYLSLLDQVSLAKPDPVWLKKFFLLEKWLLDTPDQSGCAFAEFIKILYQQNGLLHGKFRVNGRYVDLQAVTMPVLNVIARDDHIVPPQASRILKKCISSKDYSLRTLPAGHIGMYVSQKTSKRLPKMIATWLNEREAKKHR